MTMTLDFAQPVGTWVAGDPLRAQVLEKFGIDYCCGGELTFDEVCRSRKIEPGELEAAVAAWAEESADRKAGTDWSRESCGTLIDHLLDSHHAYLRYELPRLEQLAAKVAARHGEAHPELLEIQELYSTLMSDLLPHMAREEMVLFPLIRHLEQGSGGGNFHFGSVSGPISVMEVEHDAVGELLERLRKLTNGYTPPADGCMSYQAFFAGLAELEFDTHMHVHKENMLLFPRAYELEQLAAGGRSACSLS